MSTKKFFLVLIVFFVLLGLSGIPASADSTVDQPSSPTIRLKNATFDPLDGGAPVSAFQSADLSDSGENLYIIQFTGPVLEDWKDSVSAQGAKLYGYIPEFAFLARMDSSTVQNVQSLDFVRWVGPYQPDYRMASDLALTTAQPGEISKVNIETLPDADLNRLAEQIQSLGGTIEGQSQNEFAGFMTASIPSENQGQLASLEDVVYIEPWYEMHLTNDVGGTGIMRAGEVRQNLGLYGEGQIVGVTDSGLDTGNINSIHPDVAGRIIQGFGLGRPGDWSDLNGHGTHVVGSVLGNGVSSGSNPATHSYNNSYAGVAPEARLVFQSHSDVNGNLSGIPNDEGDLFRQTYPLGARIHTNSWGGPTGGTQKNPTFGRYVIPSQQVDSAAWQMKDMTILFSAGNDGVDRNNDGIVDPDSIGQPGTAKNVITVGATENLRSNINLTWGLGWPDDFKIRPISTDKTADNSSGMAAFSSRGPTDDGRIKPDVVAPGTFIASTRSSLGQDGLWGTMSSWGLAQPGDTLDQRYIMSGGTSMSTPLTAGAAAIVREWLQSVQHVGNPSSALIKAILIRGAADIAPGQYGTGSKQEIPYTTPNMVSGWGRVDLANSLIHAGRKLYFADETSGISTGKMKTYQINVGGNSTNSTDLSPVIDEASEPPAPSDQTETEETPVPSSQIASDIITDNSISSQEINSTDIPIFTVPEDEVLLETESSDLLLAEVSQQLLNNTSFEDTSDWVRLNGADYTTSNTATGSRSMQINLSGKTGNVGFYQFVHIPEDITSGSLTFSWMNNPYDATNDHLRVCFLTADLSTAIGCGAQLSDTSTGWRQNTSSLSQILESVRGKRVAIYLYGSTSSGSSSSSFFVDNISLNITRSTTQTTPLPASQQLFNNTGFESSGDWAVNSKANYTTSQAKAGSQSMQITASASGGDNFYQFVDIPDDISSATLSFSWMNNPYDAANDQLQVCILSADFAATIGCTELLSNTDTGWHQYSSSLSAILESIRGKFVIFYFYTATSGESPSSQFFVDDVNLEVTRSSTPTPQPTVQPTPTQNPNSQQILKNISFEDTSDWVMGSQASYTTTYAHTGSRSIQLTASDTSGNASYYQIVDVPSNAASATLHFAWMLDSSVTSKPQYLNICITNADTNARISCFDFGTSTTQWDSGNNIGFLAKGQRVKIQFTATAQGSPVIFYMDDVRVDVVLGTAQPTAVQPTPTAVKPTAVQQTPTAVTPTVRQLLKNTSFESNSDWVMDSNTNYTSSNAYTGNRSIQLTSHDIESASYYQIVNIPDNTTSAKLSFAYMIDSKSNTGEDLNLQVCVYNADTGVNISCPTFTATVVSSTQWKNNFNLVFSASGQRVAIRFSINAMSYQILYMDDVKLDATLGTVQPTAVQPTAIQPTSVYPTSVYPTAIQPTSVQPTSVPPTAQPTAMPTPQTGGPFKVNLVWTDYPGSVTAARALVNDLDLEVIAPDGTHYYGNSGVYSTGSNCLRNGKWDRCNNVEGITIPRALYGNYTINVIGYNVPYGENDKQPFALVFSIDDSQSANNYSLYLPVMQK